jgi:phosphatidate phosphatase APP1
MPSFRRRIASELSAKLRSPETAAFVARVEGGLTRRRRGSKVRSGAFRGMDIQVYSGYVANGVATVKVRVSEAPVLPGDSRFPYWKLAQTNLRRLAALRIVGEHVQLRIGDQSATGVTDSHGFAEFCLPAPQLRVGWHPAVATTAVTVTTRIQDSQSGSGTGQVVRPSLKAPYLVISDIDDTILLTGLTEGFAAMARTVLRPANQRAAIPGMASFYRGLARGIPSRSGNAQPEPTFFYVSTGSWSFYPVLQEFVDLRGFPGGPMFLTDWGPTERYLRRSGAEHKRTAIRQLFEAYPRMKFVLIGDSGQRDPLTYEEIAREFPGRVLLILIRQVGDNERNGPLRTHAESLRAEGIPLHLAKDAASAAQIAHNARLCDAQTLVEVRTESGLR